MKAPWKDGSFLSRDSIGDLRQLFQDAGVKALVLLRMGVVGMRIACPYTRCLFFHRTGPSGRAGGVAGQWVGGPHCAARNGPLAGLSFHRQNGQQDVH